MSENNYILGAIAGDIIGSAYEFNNVKSTDFELFTNDTFFTDDSVLTAAVLKNGFIPMILNPTTVLEKPLCAANGMEIAPPSNPHNPYNPRNPRNPWTVFALRITRNSQSPFYTRHPRSTLKCNT
jgi:hypothetical protein